MKFQVPLHLLSLLVALAFVGILSPSDYALAFYSILLGHFTLALVNWSRRPLHWKRTLYLMFPVVIAISFSLEYIGFPISIYFGIHWIMAELYFSETSKEHLAFRSIYLAFFFGFFFSTLSHDGGVFKRDTQTLAVVTTLLFLVYIIFYFLFRKRWEIKKKLMVIDISYLFFVAALYHISGPRILPPYIIMVHLLQFIFYYLPEKNLKKIILFTGINVLVSGVFFILVKEKVSFFSDGEAVISFSRVFGYFHITHAFLTSRYNPEIIRRHLVAPFYKSA